MFESVTNYINTIKNTFLPRANNIEARSFLTEKEKSIVEKDKRVKSKWNQFKSIFGFGEKLTLEEQKKLNKIRIKEYRRNCEPYNPDDDKSIFSDD